MVQFFTWSGLAFDLSIGWLLLYKKTRWVGLILILIFHITNASTLQIGIFPYFMILATILFYPPELIEKLFSKRKGKPVVVQASVRSKLNSWIKGGLIAYCCIQILLPARHLLIPGKVEWTGEGVFFAWRMKAGFKAPEMKNYKMGMLDRATNKPIQVTVDLVQLNPIQVLVLNMKPTLILQLRDRLLEDYGRTQENAIVRASLSSKLNGYPYARLILVEQDLSECSNHPFRHAKYVSKSNVNHKSKKN